MSKKILHRLITRRKQALIQNKEFSIIAKDCTGAMLLHELGMRFDTPTVNLFFTAGDYVRFCADLRSYMQMELIEDLSACEKYPVGLLGDVRIYFRHYKSFQQAKMKWEQRSRRIHWDNLFFLMTDGTGCSEDLAACFDNLPYNHKVFLTNKDYSNLRSSVRLNFRDVIGPNGIGAPELFRFKGFFSLRKVIDDWDYVSFFNS